MSDAAEAFAWKCTTGPGRQLNGTYLSVGLSVGLYRYTINSVGISSRNFNMSKFDISKIDTSKYQIRYVEISISIYHIDRVLPSIPWHPRVSYADYRTAVVN